MNGYRVFFWDDENVLELIVVMVAQLCECTKNHFKWVKCMVCGLYLNRAVILKLSRRENLLALAQNHTAGAGEHRGPGTHGPPEAEEARTRWAPGSSKRGLWRLLQFY